MRERKKRKNVDIQEKNAEWKTMQTKKNRKKSWIYRNNVYSNQISLGTIHTPNKTIPSQYYPHPHTQHPFSSNIFTPMLYNDCIQLWRYGIPRNISHIPILIQFPIPPPPPNYHLWRITKNQKINPSNDGGQQLKIWWYIIVILRGMGRRLHYQDVLEAATEVESECFERPKHRKEPIHLEPCDREPKCGDRRRKIWRPNSLRSQNELREETKEAPNSCSRAAKVWLREMKFIPQRLQSLLAWDRKKSSTIRSFHWREVSTVKFI